jgi:membrane protein required for colicin V production
VTVDLLVIGLTVLFAITGAYSGAARQISRMVAAVSAVLLTRLLAPLLGPMLAAPLQTSAMGASIISGIFIFLVAFLLIRWAAHALLLRLLAGKDLKNRDLDRGIGFMLGGTRVGLICWFALCAAVFMEDHVRIGQKKLSILPQGSVLASIARNHNVFDRDDTAAMRELVTLGRRASDPNAKPSRALEALKADPLFREAMESEAMKKALETGDDSALLQSREVMRLITDARSRQKIYEALGQ